MNKAATLVFSADGKQHTSFSQMRKKAKFLKAKTKFSGHLAV